MQSTLPYPGAFVRFYFREFYKAYLENFQLQLKVWIPVASSMEASLKCSIEGVFGARAPPACAVHISDPDLSSCLLKWRPLSAMHG